MAAVAMYCTGDDPDQAAADSIARDFGIPKHLDSDFREVIAHRFAGLQTDVLKHLMKACNSLIIDYQDIANGAERTEFYHGGHEHPKPAALNGSNGWELPIPFAPPPHSLLTGTLKQPVAAPLLHAPPAKTPPVTEPHSTEAKRLGPGRWSDVGFHTPRETTPRSKPGRAGATEGMQTPPEPKEPNPHVFDQAVELAIDASAFQMDHVTNGDSSKKSKKAKVFSWHSEWQHIYHISSQEGDHASDSDCSGCFHLPGYLRSPLTRQKPLSAFVEWEFHFAQRSQVYCQRLVVNPFSVKRLAWDMLGLVLLSYDLFTIPLEFFEPDETTFILVMFWTCVSFWTIDIGCSFMTGIIGQTYVEMRPSRIAKAYSQSWLFFDLFVLAPDWTRVILSTDSSSFLRLGKTMKSMRVLRTLRLLRLAKMQRILLQFQQRINSEHFLSYFSLVKLIVCLTAMSHYFACGFYAVGVSGSDDGWVAKYGFKGESLEYRYFSSFHWALTQIQGSIDIYPCTTAERVYAVINSVVTIIVMGGFIGWISNFMIELQKLKSDELQRQWELTRYLHDRQISPELSVRVKNWFRNLAEMKKSKADRKLIDNLPEQMRLDLEHEIKGPGLVMHPLLRVLMSKDDHMAEQLCFLAVEVMLRRGELLFRNRQPCTCVFLFLRGRMMYGSNLRKSNTKLLSQIDITEKSGSRAGTTHFRSQIRFPTMRQSRAMQEPESPSVTADLSDLDMSHNESSFSSQALPGAGDAVSVEPRMWLSEMGLWTRWANRGDAVAVAQQISQVFTLSSQDFASLIRDNMEHADRVLRYAEQYMSWLNVQKPGNINDLSGGATLSNSFIEEKDKSSRSRGAIHALTRSLSRTPRTR